MQKSSSLKGKWRNAVFFLIALLVAVADQLSKGWIRSNLLVGQSLFEVGFFRLTHVRNTGAAFGLFQDQSFLLTIVALATVVILLVCVFFVYPRFPLLDSMVGKSTLGLILGGIVGNLIDRLHLGYVTDFIDFGFWPAFNIADSAVVVGVIIFAYSLHPLLGAVKTEADKM